MAGQEVFMDIPAVQNIAKNFSTISEVLNAVNKALEALSTVLKTTAFIGMVGGLAVAQYIDQIRPQIEEMAEKCQEVSEDVTKAVEAYERGDQQGATKFY